MRLLLLALLAVVSLASEAVVTRMKITPSAINIVTIPSRQSGLGPLAVVFSGVGTTSTGATTPYLELQSTWNFGDPTSGSWSYGNAGSKNTANGAVAGHVFNCTSGTTCTYTVTQTVTDGTNSASQSVTVTVTDPDGASSPYTKTATVCIAANSLPVAGAGGCPAAASVVNATATYGSADFDQALGGCIGTDKRCLFKGGDAFTASANTNTGAITRATIGAYGTGKPAITANSLTGLVNINNSSVSDLRVQDLTVSGTGNPVVVRGSASTKSLLVSGVDGGQIFTSTGGDITTWTVVTDSVFAGNTVVGDMGFFLRLARSAVIGNSVTGVLFPGEHSARVQRCQNSLISYNTFIEPLGTDIAGKVGLTVRADARTSSADQMNNELIDTYDCYVSDNFLSGNTTSALNSVAFQTGPSADSENARIYREVVERNYMKSGAVNSGGAVQPGAVTNLAFRNNIIDVTPSGGGHVCIGAFPQNTGGAPQPTNLFFYNNSCFDNDTSNNFIMYNFTGTDQGFGTVTVKNSLPYAPNDSRNDYIVSTGTITLTGTEGNNGNPANPPNVCPKWVDGSCSTAPTTPAQYQPLTGSFAINAGVSVPVWSDYFGAARTGTYDMGAVNP